MSTPKLYIFGGLPGTGKSTLAAALARHCQACHIRIDTIEQAIRNCGTTVDGPAGYEIGYALARDNLGLGNSVVADSVNPLCITREAWIDVARQAGVSFVEIEIVCSDANEHRVRIDSRKTDIDGLELPGWNEVIARDYEPWRAEHLVLDTAGRTVDESISDLLEICDKQVTTF